MPLVLSLKEGQDFFVGDDQFIVEGVDEDTRFRLKHVQTGASHAISEEHATEVLPDVFVSAGDRPPASMARVAIEAPHSVLVLRGDKKRNPPAHVKQGIHV